MAHEQTVRETAEDKNKQSALSWFKVFWPLLVLLGSFIFAYGKLHAEVDEIKDTQPSLKSDHDTLTRIDQRQADLAIDIDQLNEKMDRVLQATERPRPVKKTH
jgi:septal ring factor EnvC (AmiA/AmiB activator)